MRLVPFLILFVCALPAAAFEVDSFKSGMTRDQVKKALKSYNFERMQDFSASTLIAYDPPEKGANRQFVFEFCNDRSVCSLGTTPEIGPTVHTPTATVKPMASP